MVNTYWDLSEKERAGLTGNQVRAFADVELMEKGILKAVKPQLMEDPKSRPLTMVSMIKVGDVYFETAEKANAFLALEPYKAESDYKLGYSIHWPVLITDVPQTVALATIEEISSRKVELMQYEAQKDEAQRQREKYAMDCNAVFAACSDLWSDWHQQRELATKLSALRETWKEYLAMSGGDKDIAKGFLLRVFDQKTIDMSVEWYGEIECNPES